MRILVAPDKFKETFSAREVAAVLAAGLRDVLPGAEILHRPMADGGEGTVDAVGGTRVCRRVTGPLPEMKVDATYARCDDGTAIIEVAAASGLHLLATEDRNPLATTTFGTGELIADAVADGVKKIVIACGGSATVDGGLGMLQALGFTLPTTDGEPMPPSEPMCGRDVGRVLMVKHGRGERTNGLEMIAAVDVASPLLGPTGAARLFGPQKGAPPQIVDRLESDLDRLVTRTSTRAEAAAPGAGAAGGLAYAVAAFMRGRIVSGFDMVAELVRFDNWLSGVDLCVTGEGRLDDSTRLGKTVAGVAARCSRRGIPCVAVVGSVDGCPTIDGLDGWFESGPDRSADGIRGAAAAAARWLLERQSTGP